MSKFKIYKNVLMQNNWQELYASLGNDSSLVAHFLKAARKAHRVPANDLDTVLNDIGKKVNEYITLDSSGSLSTH